MVSNTTSTVIIQDSCPVVNRKWKKGPENFPEGGEFRPFKRDLSAGAAQENFF